MSSTKKAAARATPASTKSGPDGSASRRGITEEEGAASNKRGVPDTDADSSTTVGTCVYLATSQLFHVNPAGTDDAVVATKRIKLDSAHDTENVDPGTAGRKVKGKEEMPSDFDYIPPTVLK